MIYNENSLRETVRRIVIEYEVKKALENKEVSEEKIDSISIIRKY